MTNLTNSTRTTSQINKSIVSFGGSLAKQWDTLASLANETARFYWNKSGQSSLVVQLDELLQSENGNKNMAKAFRLYVAASTPIILKADNEAHGKSNKKKTKTMLADFASVVAIIESITCGDDLKALLTGGAVKPKKASTITSRVESLTKAMQKDGVDVAEIAAASSAIQAMLAVYAEQLGLGDMEALDAVAAA